MNFFGSKARFKTFWQLNEEKTIARWKSVGKSEEIVIGGIAVR